jgi:hypothetical protein
MEQGELGVYAALRGKRKIGLFLYGCLSIWSLVRYVRRAAKLKFGRGSE